MRDISMQAPADNTVSPPLSVSLTGVKADTASFIYPSFYQINKKASKTNHIKPPHRHKHQLGTTLSCIGNDRTRSREREKENSPSALA